jgi:valyl-tRNA synthetase
MMAKLNTAVAEVTAAVEDYRFSEAGQLVYSLLWDDFADWYLEASKVAPNHDLLVYGLETILKLVHPIAPFVSEAIWSELPWKQAQLITTSWPIPNKMRTNPLRFEAVKNLVLAIRSTSAEEQLVRPTILTTNEATYSDRDLISRLGRTGDIKLVEEGRGLYLRTGSAWIEATNELVKSRKHRLEKQRDEKAGYLKGLEAKLANKRYVEGAPEAVVQETRDRRDETLMLLSKLDEQLADLQAK